jgi:hypothetical protein
MCISRFLTGEVLERYRYVRYVTRLPLPESANGSV